MDRYVQNLRTNYFFCEIYAIMPLMRGFGLRNRKFGGFPKANRPQNHFETEVTKVAA
jgi:hypothetical protein